MFSTSHLHPMLVHFPVALIMVGFIAEVLSMYFKKEACLSFAGFWLLIIGALSSVAAYLSGQFFTGEMSGTAGEVKELHELLASVTLYTMLANALFRIYLKYVQKEQTNLKWIALIIYGVSAIAVSATGFYGGTLVYNYMMPL